MRLIGRIVAVTVVVIIAVGAIGLLVGEAKLNAKYDVSSNALTLAVPISSGNVERGRHFATVINGCEDCHGVGLKGGVFLDVPPFRIVASNLTRGKGGIGAFSDADFVRAIRHGV